MTGNSDNNRSRRTSQEPRGPLGERSPRQRHDRRNTNRQRGRVRAMSVRLNAKSQSHRKTHQVEPDGTGRKFMHLTRGDLWRESAGEVSRGRSSEEAARKHGGAKGQRTRKKAPAILTSKGGQEGVRNRQGSGNCGSFPFGQEQVPADGLRQRDCDCGSRVSRDRAKGGGRRCLMK